MIDPVLNVSDVIESTFDPTSLPAPAFSASPIWHKSVRSEVKESKLSEAELNRKRSKHLVPGNSSRQCL